MICRYCAEDTIEHTWFECDRWEAEKNRLSVNITPGIVVEHMARSKKGWEKVVKLVHTILKQKAEKKVH